MTRDIKHPKQPAFSSLNLDPDFVICGGPLPSAGVRLFASKDLTRAELEVTIKHMDIYIDDLSPARPISQIITLSTQMGNFVIIDAPTYGMALKALFKNWSPDQEEHPAIDSGQKQLES